MPNAKNLIVTLGKNFSPKSLSPSLWLDWSDISTLYQDAAMTTPVTANLDPIGAVLDKSGNGRHVTQSTDAQRPIYKTNIKNGRSVGHASSQPMSWSRGSISFSDYVTTTVGANACTICAVVLQEAAAPRNGWLTINYLSGTNTFGGWMTYDDTIYFDFGHNTGGRISVAQPAGWDGAWHLVVERRNNTAGLIQVDNVNLSTDSFSDDLTDESAQTFGVGLGSSTFKGYWGEVLIYKTALSDANLAKVKAYLNSRWAVY